MIFIDSKHLQEGRTLFGLGWPLVFIFAADLALVTITTFSTSQISSTAVAAIGLTMNLMFLTVAFFFVVLSAITVIAAELKGSGEHLKVGPLMRSGFFIASICAVSLSLLVFVLWLVLPLIFPSEEAGHIAQDFLGTVCWIIPIEIFTAVIVFTSNGLGKTFWVGVANAASIPVAVLLTWTLAFGNFGFEAQGVQGVALAILMTLTFRCACFLLLLRQREFTTISIFRDLPKTAATSPKRILQIGLPLGASEISLHGSFAVIGMFVSQLGVVPLAAHNIVWNIFILSHLLVFGLSRATVIRVGELNGRKEHSDRLFLTIKVSMVLTLIFSLFPFLVLFFQATSIAGYYASDPGLTAQISSLLVIVAFIRPLDDASVILQAGLEGLKKTRQIFLVRVFCQWVIAVALGLVLSKTFGIYGFWGGLGVSFIFAAALFALSLRRSLSGRASEKR